MEYGQTYDGIPLVPGTVAIGLLFGSAAATFADRARPAKAALAHVSATASDRAAGYQKT
jgi:hypothetical protein